MTIQANTIYFSIGFTN
jgi:hypothetical protein